MSVVEGGEIGSGHSMIGVFEIVPTDINKGAIKDNFTTGKFADIDLQYRPSRDTMHCHKVYSSKFEYTPFQETDKSYQFYTSVVMFGSLLRSSQYAKDIEWHEIIDIATQSSSTDDLLQKEFINLVQQAKTLYSKVKKKKGSSFAQWD
jgi:Ca-activated chloride channel family protein